MGEPEAASERKAENNAAAPAQRFAVLLSQPADGSAYRVDAPSRLLRVWSLLQATHAQIDHANLPAEDLPRLHRQLRAIRRELERTVSPSLAAELRRIAPPPDEVPNAAELRIECAVLTSWAGSLTMEMLSALEAVREGQGALG